MASLSGSVSSKMLLLSLLMTMTFFSSAVFSVSSSDHWSTVGRTSSATTVSTSTIPPPPSNSSRDGGRSVQSPSPPPRSDGDVPMDKLTTRQRRQVKREILALLGLDHTPRPSASRRARERAVASYMLGLYRTSSSLDSTGGDDGTSPTGRRGRDPDGLLDMKLLDGSDTVISFTNHATPPTNQYSSVILNDPTLRRCYFDLRGELRPTEIVTSAVLRIYKFPAYGGVASNGNHAHSGRLLIEVFRLKHDVIVDWKRSSDLETNLVVDGQLNGWIDLNVTRAVSDWTRSPSRNHGLAVRVTKLESGVAVDATTVGIVGDTGPDDKQLFLVAFFKKSPATSDGVTSRPRTRRDDDEQTTTSSSDGSRGRQRRGAASRQYDESVAWPYQNIDQRLKKCQRRNLYVSFRDLEWQDWIIAPEGYAAYYCDGECSFPLHAQMNATNHAIVQTLAHLMKPVDVPKPCCAPTKLSAISVLYFDDNSNVVLKKYRNMVVRACGCH